MAPVRVLLAMSSRLLRLRIHLILAETPGIEMAGEAADGPQAAYQARQSRPDFVLCDTKMLEEPDLGALFALGAGKVPYKVVLVAAHAVMPQHTGLVPVTSVVSVEITGEALLARLRDIMGRDQARTPPPMVGMRDRFMIAEPNPLAAGKVERNTTTPLPDPANQLVRALTSPPDLVTRRLDQTRVPRRDEDVQAQLSAILGAGQQHRSSSTGLPDTDDLSESLRALPTANHPTAILVVDISFPPGVPATEAEVRNVLHSATAVLRTNVRHYDLIFHLDKITFALMLPGLEAAGAARSLRRLRNALDAFRQPNSRRPQELQVAMGIGFWQPGILPAHPLQQAWQGMVADRMNSR